MIAQTPMAETVGRPALPARPTIETRRLLLRAPELRDAELLALHLGDFAVARMLPFLPFPYDRQDALEWLLPRASGVLSGWSHVLTENGADAIGAVTIDRRGEDWMLGYWLGAPFWGRGLMSEAVLAVVAAFFEAVPEAVLHASVLSDNPASFSIQSRLGFRITGCRDVFCAPRGQMKTLIETRLDGAEWNRGS